MEKFLKVLDHAMEIFNVAALTIMLFLTAMQVLLRYAFNSPTTWSEEITLFILVWFGYIAMSVGVRKDTHISLEFLYDRLGIRGKFFLDFLRHTLMLGLSVLMTIYAFPMIETGSTNTMPATGISRSVLYAPALAGGVLMTLFSFLNVLGLFAGKGHNRA